MSKKKAEVKKPAPLLGRVGTSLKCGIVGLPNVGKSTFFNVLTESAVPAENFPFCTIDPSESRVAVPDERWDFLCDFHKPASSVPAYLCVVDIAGLVKGASNGEGLGNAFLAHIKAVDALFHIIRCFENPDVTHVEGDIDPVRDMMIINEELRLKDEEYVLRQVDELERSVVRGGDKKRTAEYECMVKARDYIVEQKKWVRFGDWNDKEIEILNRHLFITAKPVIYLVNLTPKDYMRQKNKNLRKIKEWIDENDNGAVIIPFSAEFELEWMEKSKEEKEEFSKSSEGAKSALPRIIVNGYRALQLQYFFTAGKDEVKAWTVRKGTKAPQAAGRIHTDMERGFIMAEVMSYTDFKTAGSEAAVKAAGQYKQRGREYLVEDGDIVFFRFNAGAGLSGAKKK